MARTACGALTVALTVAVAEAARVYFSLQRLPSHFNDVDSTSFSFLLFFSFPLFSLLCPLSLSLLFFFLAVAYQNDERKAIKLAEALAFVCA